MEKEGIYWLVQLQGADLHLRLVALTLLYLKSVTHLVSVLFMLASFRAGLPWRQGGSSEHLLHSAQSSRVKGSFLLHSPSNRMESWWGPSWVTWPGPEHDFTSGVGGGELGKGRPPKKTRGSDQNKRDWMLLCKEADVQGTCHASGYSQPRPPVSSWVGCSGDH